MHGVLILNSDDFVKETLKKKSINLILGEFLKNVYVLCVLGNFYNLIVLVGNMTKTILPQDWDINIMLKLFCTKNKKISIKFIFILSHQPWLVDYLRLSPMHVSWSHDSYFFFVQV